MVARWREWVAEKLNPAQPSIASTADNVSSSSDIDYREAYEEIEVIRRSIEMIINAACEVPFEVAGGPEKKIHKLLNSRPNPFEDKIRFFRRALLDLYIDGNCFIFYDKAAPGGALYILPANDVTIVPDERTFIKGYEYAPFSSTNDDPIVDFFSRGRAPKAKDKYNVIWFDDREVIHVKNDSYGSIFRGDSKLKALQRLFELYYTLTDFQRQFFKNNAVPGVVLSTDNVLSKKVKDRLLSEWQQSYTTLFSGVRSPAILDGGLKIDKFSNINFSELDFENSVERLQQDMAKGLGVPYVLMKSGNNANITPNQVVFYIHTVFPLLDMFASAFERRFGPDVSIKPDRHSVASLRPDLKVLGTYASTLVNGGIITPNEARDILRFEKLDDEASDKIRIPQNIAGSSANPSVGGRPSGSGNSSNNAGGKDIGTFDFSTKGDFLDD